MRAVCASVFVLVLATAAAAQLNPVAPPPEYREFTSKIFKIEEQFAAARKPLHTRLFMAAGGAEGQSDMLEPSK